MTFFSLTGANTLSLYRLSKQILDINDNFIPMITHTKASCIVSKAILLLFVLSPFCACISSPTETIVKINPMQVTSSGTDADTIANENCIAYLFVADTATHYFASYDEAAEGKITVKNSGIKKSFYLQAVKDPLSNILQFPEADKSVLVAVVCDTKNKIYYYRNLIAESEDVFPEFLYIELVMRPYLFLPQEDNVDKQAKWVGQQ